MFGFSFSELVVVVIVALVVMGPKDLPKMLRRVGQWAGKIRRAAADLRAQSGIDDALRSEGLSDDIAEIRKLARGELDAVQRAARVEDDYAATRGAAADSYSRRNDDFYVVRDREYPRDGADAYGALPDNAIVYVETLPRSIHARDPLYLLGDADAELPAEPEKPADDGAAGPTLIGGMGLPVPWEPPDADDAGADADATGPSDDAGATGPSDDASGRSEPSDDASPATGASPTSIGLGPAAAAEGADDADARSSDEPETAAEARS
ncbi:MAG: Sec-independent protein translocase protein TatB [Labilithrix sp.]|nr:Sec-independent protein translocase protein TatB [Labilithrix sp.]